jgi:antitoxin (DNA-binding transcriptional repressor) of toxin-antitoxin stability system
MPVRVIKSHEARTRWRNLLDIANAGETEIIIERYGKPIATLINYKQYLQAKIILEELHVIQAADQKVQEWLKNPKFGRPYSEIRNRLVEEGILDE